MGATLFPLGGSDHYGKHAAAPPRCGRGARTTRTLTSARLLADRRDPERIVSAYGSGDHLHPSDAGYRVMARAVAPGTL